MMLTTPPGRSEVSNTYKQGNNHIRDQSILARGVRLEGRGSKGRPAKRWMDCIKPDMKTGGMTSITEAGKMAMNQEAWHNVMDHMARQSEVTHVHVPMP